MVLRLRPRHGWGPSGRRAALSVTFDNFGEAAEVELGLWGDQPIGAHHSVAFLPKLMEALGDVKATYFIEACNTGIYPDAIRAWTAAGHEAAIHAWRHEMWDRCPAELRGELLGRSIAAMRALGIEPVGFRPPGGAIPGEAWDEFAAAGLLYCSEMGKPGVGRVGDVMSVPFEWHAVDVYMIEDVLGFMRLRCGDPEAPFSIAQWRTALEREVAQAVADGDHRTLIFHPNFLATSPEKLDVLTHILALAKAQGLWIAPVQDVARFAATCLDPADWQDLAPSAVDRFARQTHIPPWTL